MAWHKYTEGEAAPLHEVLTICEKHISSGDVKTPEEKRPWLQQIRDCGHSEIVY